MNPIPGVEVVLVSRGVLTPYSGMLPSRLAGWYSDADMHFNLQQLCAQAGVVFLDDELTGVDAAGKRLLLASRPSLAYNVASLNLGVTPDLPPGAEGHPHVTAVKPIAELLSKWSRLPSKAHWLVVGAGAAGFELATVLALRPDGGSVTLIDGAGLLTSYPLGLRARAAESLRGLRVHVRTGAGLVSVEGNKAMLSNGEVLAFDEMILTTGARAPTVLAESGLPVDERGFVRVDRFLRVEGYEDLFAAGDCMHFRERTLPKSGVYAVRAGPVLSRNLRVALGEDGRLRRFKPQRRHLHLLTSGPFRALMNYGPISAQGEWVWAWKDRIDREFMTRFGPREVRGTAMAVNTCGGCGGKVSGPALSALLTGLNAGPAEDVARIPGGATSIDGFRTFTDDWNLFGQVAVYHAANDLFAAGVGLSGANVYVAVPAMSERLQADVLLHMMSGVNRALSTLGASLLNAHSAEAAEAALVISVLSAQEPTRGKGPLRPGQDLILTKPLGTAILLQALRAGALSAEAWPHLRRHLLHHHLPVLGIGHIDHATDISGFGLAGHLAEMLSGSGVVADLDPSRVPLLPFALDLRAAGFGAFLESTNLATAQSLAVDELPHWMGDPQTHGPLLLAVDGSFSEACVRALKGLGFEQASVIGRTRAAAHAEPARIYIRGY